MWAAEYNDQMAAPKDPKLTYTLDTLMQVPSQIEHATEAALEMERALLTPKPVIPKEHPIDRGNREEIELQMKEKALKERNFNENARPVFTRISGNLGKNYH